MSDRVYRILVVEDEMYVQGMLEDFLTHRGYQVIVVPTAEQAFAALADKNIHLVLLDKNLPDMSGVEVLSQLRFEQPDLPVIFMTGYPSERSKLLVHHLGISEYFEKPVNLKVLAAAIVQALEVETEPEPAPTQTTVAVLHRLEPGQPFPKDECDVLVLSSNADVATMLTEVPCSVQDIALATDADQIYGFLQKHRAAVLGIDVRLPSASILPLVRWATTKDSTMSILALVPNQDTGTKIQQMLVQIGIRYIMDISQLGPKEIMSKIEILARRARTLKVMKKEGL
ncbi:MAG: response regulator transcription factor [Deltaproteobacteria bacterium]|nr:response regulator transcription factor [Deltaproteobacteria bacterium]